MSNFYDRMKASLGYEAAPAEPTQPGLLGQLRAEVTEASTLSTRNRFWAFGIAVIITAVTWGLVRIFVCSTGAAVTPAIDVVRARCITSCGKCKPNDPLLCRLHYH